MNRIFMEEYYNLKYADTFLAQAMEENEGCRKLYGEIMELDGRIEAAMRSMGEEYLMLHRKLFAAKGEFNELILRLAYLQGAEDRERMLE